MQISAVQSSGANINQINGSNSLAKVQKDFQELGSALDSGDLAGAKKAFSQLQKDAPTQGDKNNPLQDTIDDLGKALESGDLKAAQDAYSKIKDAMSHKPPTGGKGKALGGNKPTGSGDNKTYDKKDTNKDGTVSAMEELAYDLQHQGNVDVKMSQQVQQSSDNANYEGNGASIDIQI